MMSVGAGRLTDIDFANDHGSGSCDIIVNTDLACGYVDPVKRDISEAEQYDLAGLVEEVPCCNDFRNIVSRNLVGQAEEMPYQCNAVMTKLCNVSAHKEEKHFHNHLLCNDSGASQLTPADMKINSLSHLVPEGSLCDFGNDKSSLTEPTVKEVSLNPAGHLKVPIQINGINLSAVIDSAAQVSLLNQKFVSKFLPHIKTICPIKLKGIELGRTIPAQVLDNVDLELGENTYSWQMVSTDIDDDCLLGLDFLAHYQIDILLSKGVLAFGNKRIVLNEAVQDGSFVLKHVVLNKNVHIPANSGVTLPVRVSSKSFDEKQPLLFEAMERKNMIMASVLFNAGETVPFTALNLSDKTVTLLKGSVIGMVHDLSQVPPIPKIKAHSVMIDNEVNHDENGNVSTTVNPGSCNLSESDCEDGCYCERSEIPERTFQAATEKFTAEKSDDVFPANISSKFENVCLQLPSHIQDLFRKSCDNITFLESLRLANLLLEFESTFSKNDLDLGQFQAVQHRIQLSDERPIKQQMRRTPFHFEREEEEHLNKMLDAGVIAPAVSEYSHPVVLVRKKCGGVRWCIDFRCLNEVTIKDTFPLPKIDQCLDTLSGTNFYCALDLAAGYWQIEIAPEDQHKTAFATKYGLFMHKRMAFGLCNAPSTFKKSMEHVLRGLLWIKALVYLDDCLVLGDSFESTLANLRYSL